MQVIDFKKAQAIIGGWDPFAAAIQGAQARAITRAARC